MYTIEKTDYGYKVTQDGLMEIEEIERFGEEFFDLLSQHRGQFSLFFDFRRQIIPTLESAKALMEVRRRVLQLSCLRAAVVFDTGEGPPPIRIPRTDDDNNLVDCIIDVQLTPDWESAALAWLIHGVEPANV